VKRLLAFGLMPLIALLVWSAEGATPTKKKKTPAKSSKTAASKKKAPVKKGATKSATKSATTWRNRQLSPSPERYREIQQALVSKGYLSSEDANGAWNQNSIDALKRFQSEQNLDPSGKINSLSLIALGLGPKRETAAPPPPPKPPQ
jgi:putative peptidoglycan binding protein